LTGLQESCQQ